MSDRSAPRLDHFGVTVADMDAVVAFFVALGFEVDGRMEVSGDDVGRIIGLDAPRSEIAMLKAPDGSGKLELSKFHEPASDETPRADPIDRLGLRHVCIEIADVDAAVERARADGYDTVGDTVAFGGTYRLVYVRGPEGLIVELAERVSV